MTAPNPLLMECSWCGAGMIGNTVELTKCGRVLRSRGGEPFCCRAHRDASARAVKNLHDQHESRS